MINFCPKCGDAVEPGEVYCNKCGAYLGDKSNNDNSVNHKKFLTKKKVIVGAIISIIVLFLVVIISSTNSYYFSNMTYNSNNTDTTSSTNTTKGKYSTAIITDHVLTGVSVNNEADAYKLISDDSVNQKSNCPEKIKAVEDEIINDYGITAVNLCEMDVDFASELANVFKKIYTDYPSVRGYLTNLSLMNTSMSDSSIIAAFMPVFVFAKSNSQDEYPLVIKTQLFLSARYFLDKDRLQQTTSYGSAQKHFPANATIYSPVAHELGHYLSFLALTKHYNTKKVLLVNANDNVKLCEIMDDFSNGSFSLKMLKEAFENYQKDTSDTTISFDDWRGTISGYALAKDNEGNYIYDESIAESFHDVYLNGDKAVIASKYVVAVLKKYLES